MIELKLDRLYKSRRGTVVRIVEVRPHHTFKFRGDNSLTYTQGGRYFSDREEDGADLIEEVQETSPGLEKGETDPNGVPANAPGSKLDAGKPRPALVLGEFARALSAVVDIGTFGARKYTPKGWVSVPDGQERYADAAGRHQLEVWKGNKFDNGKGGTGGLHKAQVIWNLLAELELELREEESK